MKYKVYIETSVISYLTAKPSRDIIISGHQQITNEWWDNYLQYFEPFISSVVIDEISRGDSLASSKRLTKVINFNLLDLNEEVRQLANIYFKYLNIPEKAESDAYHLAFATIYYIDFLASWNCKHIVSGRVKKIINEINKSHSLFTPIILTPEELMEGFYE